MVICCFCSAFSIFVCFCLLFNKYYFQIKAFWNLPITTSTKSRYTFGVPCKIGYGYNDTLRHYHKFDDANPQNVTSTVSKHVFIGIVNSLSCTYWIRYLLGQLLEDQILKLMDFNIVNDDRDYYRFGVFITTKKETCSSCEKLPENTEYYVNGVDYGMHLQTIVAKNEFPNSKDEMEKLLKSAVEDINKLTEIQKKAKCRVLINSVEEREMTLENVFKFTNEFLEGQHPEYEIVVVAGIEKNKHTAIQVKTDVNFQSFLMYVYTTYRKIEMKLETTGHPKVVPVPDRALTFVQIGSNLQKAKDEFSKVNLKDDDIFKLYQVLKTLFWNYRYYLEFVIEKKLDVDDLPPGWEEGADLNAVRSSFNSLYKKLNRWTPVKIGNQWYTSEDKLLIVPNDFDLVKTRVKQLIPGIAVKRDNQLTEPHLFIHPEINGSFGFVDMSRPSPNTIPTEIMEVLTLKCPESCSENELQWICQVCGKVMKKNKLNIACNCGTKFFDRQLFVCNHLKHKINAMNTAALKTIALQLQKYQDKNENAIKNAVQKIVKIDKETDEITVLMKEMRNLKVFDGDTSYLIEKYLK